MVRIAAYLLVGIGIGVAFALWQGSGSEPVGEWDDAVNLEDRGPIEKRLSELETSLALERYEREALAEELSSLRASVASAASAVTDTTEEPRDRGERTTATTGDDDGDFEQRARERFAGGSFGREQFDENFFEQRQLQRYVDAGLSADRAHWIMQREEALEMELLQARYEATQAGASAAEIARIDQTTVLRQELGDADFEKYLEGQGRPTTINVREVLSNSPAESAGLQAGDEIVAYGGKRVFDMSELTELTYDSKPGQAVAIEVLRNGQPMQVYVTSGPIGISGGGRQRGRR